MIEYYYFPTSHWSRVISMLLVEKDIDVQKRFVDIRKNATFEPEYMRRNPNGVVPTLVVDGAAICNSPRIAAYIDELRPEPPMLQGHPERPLVETWAQRLEALPLMLFSYSVWVLGMKGERSKDILNDKVERAKEYAAKYPDLADQYRRKAEFFTAFRTQVYDEDHVARETQRWRSVLEELGDVVRTRAFIGGGSPCFADCIAASILFRFRDLGRIDEWSRDSSHPLEAYFVRLRARASFVQVYCDDPLIPA